MTAHTQDNKHIAKNTVILFVRMIFLMSVSLYTTRAILRILGTEDFGIYNIVAGVVVFFSFLNQSMSTTTARFITAALGKKDAQLLSRTFCMAANLHFCFAVLILIVGETIGLWMVKTQLVIPDERLTAAVWTLHASVIGVCISTLNVPYKASIISHERMGAFACISIIPVVCNLAIVLILPIFHYDRLVVYSVLIVAVNILVHMTYWLYSRREFIETRYIPCWDKKIWREVASFFSWNIMGDLAFMCNTQGINMILNMFFGPIVNAARGVMVQVESVMLQFVNNFQTSVTPQITKSYSEGDVERTRTLVVMTSKFCFFLMLLLFVPLFLEMDFIMNLWLHDVPVHAVNFCRIVLCICALDCLMQPLHNGIFAVGAVRRYRVVTSTIYLTYIPISYTLLKFWHVSPETIVGLLIVLKLFVCIVRIERVQNLLGLLFGRYLTEAVVPSAVCMIVSLALPTAEVILVKPSLERLLLTCVLSVFWSVGVIYKLGLSQHERHLVLKGIGKLKEKLQNRK